MGCKRSTGVPAGPTARKELASRSPKGVSAVRSAVKELEAHGYVKRRVIRNLNGKIKEWEITVYELPMTDFPAADYPPSENIDLENEDLENCTLLNIQDQLNIEDQQNINHTKKHMCVDIESSCHSDNPRSADTLLDFLTNPENAKGNVPKVWHVLNKYLHDDNP